MFRVAWRPSSVQPTLMVIVATLVAGISLGSPIDDPKPKTSTSKKAGNSKSKAKTKGAEDSKADDSKPKSTDDKKAEEFAKNKDAAFKAVEAYLILIDKGKYGESWETMTAEVRKGITRRKWVDGLGKTRATFGPLQGRKLNRIQMRATEVAERYDEAWIYTDFLTVEGETASELIIVVLQNAKNWVVCSYYVGNPSTFPKPPAEEEEPKPAEKEAPKSAEKGAPKPAEKK